MSRIVMFLAAIALVACSASEVEDLGVQSVQKKADLGEKATTKAGNWGGALMTSGSFTMMAATGTEEEEEDKDELGEANDWDITNGGQCKDEANDWDITNG